MQCCVIYLETWGGTHLLLHSRHYNFVIVCFWQNTRYRLRLHCISQCLFWLVSNLFSWFVDGDGLPCLTVKTLSGVALSVVTHSDACKPVTTGTVGREFAFVSPL
jgi:hypothetical protein